MATLEWLGVLTSRSSYWIIENSLQSLSSTVILGSIMIFIVCREVVNFAKLPPPVFSGDDTDAPGMRWVGRNDPFLTIQERRYPNV